MKRIWENRFQTLVEFGWNDPKEKLLFQESGLPQKSLDTALNDYVEKTYKLIPVHHLHKEITGVDKKLFIKDFFYVDFLHYLLIFLSLCSENWYPKSFSNFKVFNFKKLIYTVKKCRFTFQKMCFLFAQLVKN